MKGMSKFQLILTGVFAAFILIGVLIFSLGGRSDSKEVAKATIWGTMSSGAFSNFLQETGLSRDKTVQITYVEKRRDTFDQEFVEALAVGRGPDLFFLPQDSILKHQEKIFVIPYNSYPERTFKDSFVEEAELYMTSNGILGIPFLIDPMVMYWNRDMFSSAGLSLPPKYWSDMYDLSNRLTSRDSNQNIGRATIAFGEYGNINNVNELLSLLVLQAGNPITTRGADGVSVNNLFSQKLDLPIVPAVQSLNFYTEFANPLKPFYTWNRSLPSSKDFFLSSDLAMYFGFASELSDLRLKNPNLNFSVAPIPQAKDADRVTTFGRMIALAIPKNSQNIAGAFAVANKLTTATALNSLVAVTNLPPVRRELLSTRPSEDFMSVFYEGAIQSRAWLSPDSTKLGPVFKEMIESVTSGRTNVTQAVSKAHGQLDKALQY